jgi:hypothetical protein
MGERLLYHEKISSNLTTRLFVGLALLFFALFYWRLNAGGLKGLAVVFLFFFVFFLFYAVNYRKIIIRITPEAFKLTFGIFTCRVAMDNIESCGVDVLQPVEQYGGAGIHFMLVRGRYRVNYNFLEYPRMVIGLKRKSGPVNDISFSTRRPDDILEIIQKTASTGISPHH